MSRAERISLYMDQCNAMLHRSALALIEETEQTQEIVATCEAGYFVAESCLNMLGIKPQEFHVALVNYTEGGEHE